VTKTPHKVPITGLHYDGSVGREQSQRAEIRVIHVCMGEEDQVDRRQLSGTERRLHQTARSQLGEAPTDTDSALKRRICENAGALQIQEYRGVTQPRSSECIVPPGLRIGSLGSGSDVGSRHSLF
jgi:hypothetical protein